MRHLNAGPGSRLWLNSCPAVADASSVKQQVENLCVSLPLLVSLCVSASLCFSVCVCVCLSLLVSVCAPPLFYQINTQILFLNGWKIQAQGAKMLSIFGGSLRQQPPDCVLNTLYAHGGRGEGTFWSPSCTSTLLSTGPA